MSFGLFLLYVVLTFMRPIELLAPELGQMRPMLILSLLTLTLSLFKAIHRKEAAAQPVNFKLIGAFVFVMALSTALSGWAGGAAYAANAFMPSMFLYLMVLFNVTNLRRLKITAAVAALAMTGAAAMSIYSYHTGWHQKDLVFRQGSALLDQNNAEEIAGPRPDVSEEVVPALETSGWYLWRIRGMGTLHDPNDFSQMMVAVLPMLWALWARRRWLLNTVLILLPTAVMGYGIFLTQSRGAILGLGAMVLFGIRKRLGLMRTMIVMGILAVAGILVSTMTGRAYSSQEQSAGDRVEAWSIGIEQLRAHPLFGIGFDNFTNINALTAHNSFVLAFAETGLIGFFLWMGLIVVPFKSLSKVAQVLPANSAETRWAEMLMTSMVGFLTCAWFLSRAYEPQLFFVLGMGMAGWYVGTREPIARMKGSLPYRLLREVHWVKPTLISCLLAILAAYTFVRLHWLAIL